MNVENNVETVTVTVKAGSQTLDVLTVGAYNLSVDDFKDALNELAARYVKLSVEVNEKLSLSDFGLYVLSSQHDRHRIAMARAAKAGRDGLE